MTLIHAVVLDALLLVRDGRAPWLPVLDQPSHGIFFAVAPSGVRCAVKHLPRAARDKPAMQMCTADVIYTSRVRNGVAGVVTVRRLPSSDAKVGKHKARQQPKQREGMAQTLQMTAAASSGRQSSSFNPREALRNVRVIQRNLVYVVGLAPHLAREEVRATDARVTGATGVEVSTPVLVPLTAGDTDRRAISHCDCENRRCSCTAVGLGTAWTWGRGWGETLPWDCRGMVLHWGDGGLRAGVPPFCPLECLLLYAS